MASKTKPEQKALNQEAMKLSKAGEDPLPAMEAELCARKAAVSTIEEKIRILEAIEGHQEGIPHVMSLAVMFGGAALVMLVSPVEFVVIGPLIWMAAVLVRLVFVFSTGEWIDYTPKNFSWTSWRMFLCGFFGFKCR